MLRNTLLGLLVFQALMAGAQSGSISTAADESTRPNILFLLIDDLNDYVGFLGGHPQSQTPHMDELATRGISFENAYASSPKCGPSRASLLTGLHPTTTGVINNPDLDWEFRNSFPADMEVFPLPAYLKDSAGYFTYCFNKMYHGWDYQGHDNDFDSLSPVCEKGLSWNKFFDFSPKEDFRPKDDLSENGDHHGLEKLSFGPAADADESRMNDYKVVDSVLYFLDHYASSPQDYCDKPFFAGVGILRPHNPFFAPWKYFLDFYDRDFEQSSYPIIFNDPPNLFPPNGVVHTGFPTYYGQDYDELSELAKLIGAGSNDLDAMFRNFAETKSELYVASFYETPEWTDMLDQSMRSLSLMSYLACIKFVDWQIGRIMEKLDEHPALRDNTIIVLTSDHGYATGEHRHYNKGALWETDLRIPMVIIDPRKNYSGTSSRQISLLDLYPTLMSMIDQPEPLKADGSRYLDGYDLSPLLKAPSKNWTRPVLSTYRLTNKFDEGDCFPHHSVRSDRFHYIRYQTNGGDPCDEASSVFHEELYDLGTSREIDPHEWFNLAANPDYAAEIEYLQQFLPGGNFYQQPISHLAIEAKGLSCEPAPTDSIELTARHFNLDGKLSTMPDPSMIRWSIRYSPLEHTGKSVRYSISELLTYFPSGEIDVRLEFETTAGLLIANEKFHLRVPSSNFYTNLNQSQLQLAPGTHSPNFVADWDYGDGTIVRTKQPSIHQYSYPEVFDVTRSIHYRPDGKTKCLSQTTKQVFVPVDSFTEISCHAPTAISLKELSASEAEIAWSPVYKSQGQYTYRYVPTKEQYDVAAAEVVTTEAGTSLSELQPDTRYRFQVSATCAVGRSAWSHPFEFRTAVKKALDEPTATAPARASMVLSPNPANRNVTIALTGEISQLTIFDNTGRQLRQLSLSSKSVSVETADLLPGLYLVRGADLNGVEMVVSKLIVQR